MTNDILKKKIMRRVYMVWLAKRVVNPVSIKFVGLFVAFAWLRQYVSIKHVLYNSPSFTDLNETVSFFSHAFLNTNRLAEFLIVAVALLAVFLVRDAVKRFRMAGEYQALSSMLG